MFPDPWSFYFISACIVCRFYKCSSMHATKFYSLVSQCQPFFYRKSNSWPSDLNLQPQHVCLKTASLVWIQLIWRLQYSCFLPHFINNRIKQHSSLNKCEEKDELIVLWSKAYSILHGSRPGKWQAKFWIQ